MRCKRADESERSTRTQPLLSDFKGALAFKRLYERLRGGEGFTPRSLEWCGLKLRPDDAGVAPGRF